MLHIFHGSNIKHNPSNLKKILYIKKIKIKYSKKSPAAAAAVSHCGSSSAEEMRTSGEAILILLLSKKLILYSLKTLSTKLVTKFKVYFEKN